MTAKVIALYTNDGTEPKELVSITFTMENQADRLDVTRIITRGSNTWAEKPESLKNVGLLMWAAVNGKGKVWG